MIPYNPLKPHDLATDLATLGNLESITIGVRIDLDDDPLDRNARCLAAANRLHRNEAGGLQLRQRARKVRLCPSAHLHQLRNRLRLAVPNDRKELAVLRSQQPHHGIDRIDARFPRVGWRRALAARYSFHFFAQRAQTLNLVLGHLIPCVSSTSTTVVSTPRSFNTRSTSSKKSSINVSASLNWYGCPGSVPVRCQ